MIIKNLEARFETDMALAKEFADLSSELMKLWKELKF
jgi:hypothetical protein